MRRLLTIALLLVPSLAVAQRGGGTRSQADKHTDTPDVPLPAGPSLRVRDVEDMSPVKLLIDKRKDLKLTDAQLSALKDAEPKLKDKNAHLLKAVDSLVHEMRPGINNTQEDKDRIRDARNGMMSTLDQLRANYDEAAKAALGSLDETQQTKANELLAKQREESEKMLKEKLAGAKPSGGSQH